MRKTLLFLFILLIVSPNTKAQTASFFSNNANIVVTEGAFIQVNGDAEFWQKVGHESPILQLDGTLAIQRDLINDVNGLFDKTTGTIHFFGEETSWIHGKYSINIAHLYCKKSGVINIKTPLTVRQSLRLDNGILELDDYSLNIGDSLYTKTHFCDTVMVSTVGEATLNLKVKETKSHYHAPIGSYDRYTPVSISANNIKTEGDQPHLKVKTIEEAHPVLPNDENYLMRYWNINREDFSADNFSMDFSFSPGDAVGDARLFYGLKVETKDEGFWPKPFGLVNATSNMFHVDDKTLGEYTAAQIGGSEFSSVIVFPNPSDGQFFIKVVNEEETNMLFQFFDSNGAFLFEGTTDQGVFYYDFSNFTPGTYFYKIFFEDRILTRKIIITN